MSNPVIIEEKRYLIRERGSYRVWNEIANGKRYKLLYQIKEINSN